MATHGLRRSLHAGALAPGLPDLALALPDAASVLPSAEEIQHKAGIIARRMDLLRRDLFHSSAGDELPDHIEQIPEYRRARMEGLEYLVLRGNR